MQQHQLEHNTDGAVAAELVAALHACHTPAQTLLHITPVS